MKWWEVEKVIFSLVCKSERQANVAIESSARWQPTPEGEKKSNGYLISAGEISLLRIELAVWFNQTKWTCHDGKTIVFRPPSSWSALTDSLLVFGQ